MIPSTGWRDAPDTVLSPVMENLPIDSRNSIYRLDAHGFTWHSIELVHEAFGDQTSITCTLSQSGSIALYEVWSQMEGVDLDIAGAWAISLGRIIYFYDQRENASAAIALAPILSDFSPRTVAVMVEHMNAEGYKGLSALSIMLEHGIDADLFLSLIESDNPL